MERRPHGRKLALMSKGSSPVVSLAPLSRLSLSRSLASLSLSPLSLSLSLSPLSHTHTLAAYVYERSWNGVYTGASYSTHWQVQSGEPFNSHEYESVMNMSPYSFMVIWMNMNPYLLLVIQMNMKPYSFIVI